MKKLFIIITILYSSFSVYSQNGNDSIQFSSFYQNITTKTTSPNQGKVSIIQDTAITKLIEKHVAINKADINLSGWRIQIYNSSGKEARDEANEVRNKFMNTYSDIKAYLIYQPPFFKIRVGDYRTKADAFTMYKTLLSVYPLSYLVQEKINLPPVQ